MYLQKIQNDEIENEEENKEENQFQNLQEKFLLTNKNNSSKKISNQIIEYLKISDSITNLHENGPAIPMINVNPISILGNHHHQQAITCVTLSPDDRIAYSSSKDGTIIQCKFFYIFNNK